MTRQGLLSEALSSLTAAVLLPKVLFTTVAVPPSSASIPNFYTNKIRLQM
jgi:hypothetical protein